MARAVAVTLSVFARDLRGDSDVTAGGSREREHVGRLVFAAKAAVEFAQALVGCDQDIHFALDFREFLRASGKALKLRRAYAAGGNAGDRWIENYHRRTVNVKTPN